jgi:hypothetical protein
LIPQTLFDPTSPDCGVFDTPDTLGHMQTQGRPNPLTTRQQPSLYPERRMPHRNRGPKPGNRMEAAGLILKPESHGSETSQFGSRKPRNQEPKLNQEPSLGPYGFLAAVMPLCRAIRGRLGDRVYKTYGDKIIVTRVPRFEGYVPSAAQRDRRDRMRSATAFAQAVYADPAAKAVYVAAAKILGRQPFRLAVADFLHGRSRVKVSGPKSATATRTMTGCGNCGRDVGVPPRRPEIAHRKRGVRSRPWRVAAGWPASSLRRCNAHAPCDSTGLLLSADFRRCRDRIQDSVARKDPDGVRLWQLLSRA